MTPKKRARRRESVTERGERFAEDAMLGFKALGLVAESTSGFPGLASSLRRLERVLLAIQSGPIQSNFHVSEVALQ